jgi:hypothetical protein
MSDEEDLEQVCARIDSLSNMYFIGQIINVPYPLLLFTVGFNLQPSLLRANFFLCCVFVMKCVLKPKIVFGVPLKILCFSLIL